MVNTEINSLSIPAQKSSGISHISTNKFRTDDQGDNSSSSTSWSLLRMRFLITLITNFESFCDAVGYRFVQVLGFFQAFDFVQEFFF